MRKAALTWAPSLLLLLLAPTRAHAQACVQGWGWRVPITVNNTANSSAFADLEVAVSVDTATPIAAGHMLASGADIRFTDGSSCLCHTVASGLGSASTTVWVRVPSVPASGSTTIWMYYGNGVATSTDDPYCTFSFYEGFEDDTLSFTAPSCGSVTTTVAGGSGTISWASSGVLVSSVALSQSRVYVGEAEVVSASGSWPGLYWALDDANQRSYSALVSPGSFRIGVSGTGSGWCQGQNWASAVLPYSSTAGLWQLTWAATGDIRASFPTVGDVTSADTTLTRNADLRLMLGGISSGAGSMTVDWVRARQLASPAPTTSGGAEEVATVSADVSIAKSVSAPILAAGGPVSFTITASNAGPGSVVGATVTDVLPAAIGSATWSCAASGGATCAASGSGSIADSVDLPSGASVTYTVLATVSASASGPVANTATIALPLGFADPTPSDNAATASASVFHAEPAIPALGSGGLVVLVLLFAAAGIASMRRIA